MNAKKVKEIFSRFQKENPDPKLELKYRSPFELLVAVVLSAQATDVGVNKATPALFKVANTPKKMVKLGDEGLTKYIKSIGLFNTKAKNIIKTSQILVNRYNGQVPSHREALEALPGVGRKTANVILNAAFDQPTIAVDTHVFRVANRLNLAPGKDVVEVEQKLLKTIPKKFRKHAHHWLILHGRYICTAKKPHCTECFLNDLCEYENKEL
jgi:endonuclease-3